MIEKIELGDRVKDNITGFTGIAIAITKWLHGCNRVTIQPEKTQGGKPGETATFDEPQLTLLKKKVIPGTDATGGPRPEPSRGADPR